MRSRSLRRFAAGSLVVAVTAGGSSLLGGVADAEPHAGTLGTLTFIPLTGSDTEIIKAHTSAGCDAASSAAKMDVTGPVGSTNPVFPPDNPYAIKTAESNDFSNTDPFDIPEANHLKAAADSQGKVLAPGEYDFTVTCVDQDTLKQFGTFTGAIFFTDATHYNTGSTQPPPGSPSPSPMVSPSVTPTPNPMSTDSPTPTLSPTSDSATDTPTSTSDAAGATTSSDSGSGGAQPVASSGNLANTGAPIALIFLGGLVLLASGLAFVVWMKRPKKASLSDGNEPSER